MNSLKRYGSKHQPFALIYPSNTSNCKNVLFIDNEVKNAQLFASSVNGTTFPIIYSRTSTKTDLLAILNTTFTSIERISFAFASSSSGNSKAFLDGKTFFTNEEENPYSENVEFIISIIKEFQIKNVDYLACDTLNYPKWVNYYDILTKETGVIIGASNDKTGNIKIGGDWVMESTSQNIELIYFTKSIEYYSYLLDNIPIWAATGVNPLGIAIYNEYLYVTNFYDNTIGKISLTDPINDNNQSWAATGDGPVGIAIYNGYLYVTNFYDNTIGKISLTDPINNNNQS